MPWWLTALENLAGGALGGIATVYGLSRWLGAMWLEKQKARYNKELEEFKDGFQKEQKRVQAAIDRHVFVTRAQFDTEFNAMKEVFKGLAELMLAINAVRPMLSTSPNGEDKEDKKRRLFETPWSGDDGIRSTKTQCASNWMNASLVKPWACQSFCFSPVVRWMCCE